MPKGRRKAAGLCNFMPAANPRQSGRHRRGVGHESRRHIGRLLGVIVVGRMVLGIRKRSYMCKNHSIDADHLAHTQEKTSLQLSMQAMHSVQLVACEAVWRAVATRKRRRSTEESGDLPLPQVFAIVRNSGDRMRSIRNNCFLLNCRDAPKCKGS